MRTINLKFIVSVLFAFVFILGGFFVSTMKAHAEESFSPSFSKIESYANVDGGTSTIMRIGCEPGSGDIYDINSGKLCKYITSLAKKGCVLGSGDKYDVNTGAICLYGVPNVRVGCAAFSVDKYDVNTGKLCTNKTKIFTYTPITPVSPVGQVNGVSTEVLPPGGPQGVNTTTTNPTITQNELTTTPSLDKNIDNTLTEKGEKFGSIFAGGPLSLRAILLLIIIILGIGYGIYSFLRKDPEDRPAYVMSKEKKAVVKPVITATPTTGTQTKQAKTPQEQPVGTQTPSKSQYTPVNTAPAMAIPVQNKIPDAPLSHTQPAPENPQMPLNMPSSSSQQGQQINKEKK